MRTVSMLILLFKEYHEWAPKFSRTVEQAKICHHHPGKLSPDNFGRTGTPYNCGEDNFPGKVINANRIHNPYVMDDWQ